MPERGSDLGVRTWTEPVGSETHGPWTPVLSPAPDQVPRPIQGSRALTCGLPEPDLPPQRLPVGELERGRWGRAPDPHSLCWEGRSSRERGWGEQGHGPLPAAPESCPARQATLSLLLPQPPGGPALGFSLPLASQRLRAGKVQTQQLGNQRARGRQRGGRGRSGLAGTSEPCRGGRRRRRGDGRAAGWSGAAAARWAGCLHRLAAARGPSLLLADGTLRPRCQTWVPESADTFLSGLRSPGHK